MAAGQQGGFGTSTETTSASSGDNSSLLAGLEDVVSKLYATSEASRFGITVPDFTHILGEIVEKYCIHAEEKRDRRELLLSLKVGELALARACAAGNESAWESLLNQYRAPLYEMACTIAKDDVIGRELADSLYGELYGITPRGERCPSKLNYYNGIGSLAGWLRTILVQNSIDRHRREQRLTSLDEDEEDRPPVPEIIQQPFQMESAPDPRLNEAVDAALAKMDPEDRLVLASYYLDHQKLIDIADSMNVHVSTVSRRLEKITAKLRKTIRTGLLKRGMSPHEVEEAFSADVRDVQVNVAGRLKENTQKEDSESFFQQRGTSKPTDPNS